MIKYSDKCKACGYLYHKEVREVDVVIRYQSGKRKGEIKEVTKGEEVFEIGHSPFITLTFEKEVDRLGVKYDDYYKSFVDKTLYVCPECGTVKTNL